MIWGWFTFIIFTSGALTLYHMISAPFLINKVKNKKIHYNIPTEALTILVPCYNEEDIISSSLLGMDNVMRNYPNLEYVFINDGSTDNTLIRLQDSLKLVECNKNFRKTLVHNKIIVIYVSTIYNNVYVIDKVNGGKSDALNAGINFSSSEIVVTLDADTLLDKKALHIINNEFKDESIIGAGGLVNILQSGEYFTGKMNFRKLKLIIKLQILDYLKGFMILKASLSRMNSMIVVSGAFGVFRKDVLIAVNGFRHTIGEDMDITLKLHLYAMKNSNKRVIFMPNAVAYTECPVTWRELFNQRVRWQKAFVDCVIVYFFQFLRNFFKSTLPFFFIIEAAIFGMLLTIYNIFQLLYFCAIKHTDNALSIITAYFIAIIIISVLNTIVTFCLYKQIGGIVDKKNLGALLLTVIAEVIIFKTLTVLYIICGTLLYFVNKHKWNKVSRTGEVYYSKGA